MNYFLNYSCTQLWTRDISWFFPQNTAFLDTLLSSLNLKLHLLGKKYQCHAYTNHTNTHIYSQSYVLFFFIFTKKITCYPLVWNLSEYIFHVLIRRRKIESHFFSQIAISSNNKNETHFSALNNFIKHNCTCWPPGQHILIESTFTMAV